MPVVKGAGKSGKSFVSRKETTTEGSECERNQISVGFASQKKKDPVLKR